MDDLGRQLGRRIYQFRKQRRLTQAALAEKAKISNEFMSAIERGAKLPALPTLNKLADALRVCLRDLFTFEQREFRQSVGLSREALDLAHLVDALSPQKRRQIVKITKILTEPES